MIRTALAFTLFSACSFAAGADDPAKADAVKKLVQKLGDATLKGDYGMVIDHTHDGLVKKGGGREAVVKQAADAMAQIAKQGVKLKSYTAGEPGEFHTEGGNTFVVVPTALEMSLPAANVRAKGYVVGISADGGKTWKFVEGAGVKEADFDGEVLPKLPPKLKLPAKEKPQIIKKD